MRLQRSWLALAATAALAGCATAPRQPPPPPVRVRPAPAPAAVSPADYISRAGSIDLFEVKSGELALQRSSSARVRYVANVMIAAHEGTGSQLSLAGRRLNLLPSAELLPPEQAMLDQLSASGDFDGTYLRQQRTIAQAAYRLHQAFALRGSSPTLRPVAANAAAVEKQHIELLGRL